MRDVIPANAGISVLSSRIAGKQTEIPAFAGMTPVDLAREQGIQTLQATGSIESWKALESALRKGGYRLLAENARQTKR